ncbi:hypothetical protein RGQ29_011390, partial [Quercus rubra]
KQRAMSEVRSSELEKGLSSSNDPVKVEEDIVASSPWEIKAFHTLGEVCGLDIKTLSRFRDRFQLPERVKGGVLLRAAFLCRLRFPIHPFIMELLGHFNIALEQLKPNSWRIVISYIKIWLAATEGNMIKVNELTYLYHLKKSKEYGYYELVP